MKLKGEIFDLLDPIAKSISEHIYKLEYFNKYYLTIDKDGRFTYMTFSTEGWGTRSSTDADRFVKKMLRDYSFNIQGWSNKRNTKGGFGNHDEITVIFEKANITDHYEALQVLGKSLSTITKYKL